MINTTLSSSSATAEYSARSSHNLFRISDKSSDRWWVFAAASFLVSVPVFAQAPLVRNFPTISLLLTLVWVGLGCVLWRRPTTQLWGDVLLGFSWSWLAGSIYWGWWRWEPLIHLPMEAIGLPFALWCLWQNRQGNLTPHFSRQLQVGNWFYLGSLLGTAVTDLYFYLVGVIPHWRQIMQVDPALATPIFQSAIATVKTPWGVNWAVILVTILLGMGIASLQKKQLHWWAFGGAVLSTILVDSLFLVAASLA